MKSDFVPEIWAEDPTPQEAKNCEKCQLCRQRARMIWGEGNPEAPVLVVLDNPGAREDRDGVQYVCPTRQTLQEAADRAGLKKDDLYVSYILKCRPLRKYAKEEARSACLPYLLQQLDRQRPKLAFCLGNTAVQWFFGDPEAEVKNLRGEWHTARGIETAVSYHPLAVRRRPNLRTQFNADWKMLADRLT
jgi:uracil-DNA glycosylase family 4